MLASVRMTLERTTKTCRCCLPRAAIYSAQGKKGRGSATTAASGQTLVEFSLVLLVFMLLTVGLLDGLRVIFYYTQIQEAAREGARWGAVQVARTAPGNNAQSPWGTFGTTGNAIGVYCDRPGVDDCPATGTTPLTSSRTMGSTSPVTSTIVGAVTQATNAVDVSRATVTISTTIDPSVTEYQPSNPAISNKSISVTVQYRFRPILAMVFGGVTIPLQGTSSMLHE